MRESKVILQLKNYVRIIYYIILLWFSFVYWYVDSDEIQQRARDKETSSWKSAKNYGICSPKALECRFIILICVYM